MQQPTQRSCYQYATRNKAHQVQRDDAHPGQGVITLQTTDPPIFASRSLNAMLRWNYPFYCTAGNVVDNELAQ